jgi:hypothetical protein
MSIDHVKAVMKYKRFSGNTKLLLFVLADRASNGEGKGKTRRDYGWSFAGVSQLMMDTGIKSRDTITDCLATLQAAGVIKRARRMGTSSRTFVDIDALRALAYSDKDRQDFRRKAGVRQEESNRAEEDEAENFQQTDDEETPACVVGENTATIERECPAIVAGKIPADNPKKEPSAFNQKYFNSSESKSKPTDPDLDIDDLERQNLSSLVCKSSGEVRGGVSARSRQELLLGDGIGPDAQSELRVLSNFNIQALFACHGNVPVSRLQLTPSSEFPLSPNRDPIVDDYEQIVHLCSIWWAIQQRHSSEKTTEDQWAKHPWGHPRTWTAKQRRYMFKKRSQLGGKTHSISSVADEPDAEDEERSSADHEQALLADERAMASLYYMHGFEGVKRLLEWLPTSTYWYQNPEKRLSSLRQLCIPGVWRSVSQACENYLVTRPVENGSEEECEQYVQDNFHGAGGDDVEQFCQDRLNPVDPLEAAEEEEMYRLDYLD